MDKNTLPRVAVIGMSCRLPGIANSLENYWQLLLNQQDAVTEIPVARMKIDEVYSETKQPGKTYTRQAAFVQQNIKAMDAAFFNISAKEASFLDPQQRLLLEVAWEALEHAHLVPDQIRESNAGVFIGISGRDYADLIASETDRNDSYSPYTASGNAFSTASGRIAYYLDSHGPTVSIDTACSSALVALHYAVKSIQTGECTMAIAGGVSLILSNNNFINFSQATMLSPDGRCKSFDRHADGYGRGEGCGIVILKALDKAITDGDRILAVIPSSAINQDGHSAGLTAPNGLAQEQLIRQAIQQAQLSPKDIDYIEAHGTGTPLGDPIEFNALHHVFATEKRAQPLIIGTAKTHIGHLEAAAGIAGFIKTVLSLQHQQIPQLLHFQELNPTINAENSSLQLATQTLPWPMRRKHVRRAGVSSFGFSGTNAHVIVEEAPKLAKSAKPTASKKENYIFAFSAKTLEARNALREIYIDYLQNTSDALPDIAYSSLLCRKHFMYRAALVVASKEDLIEKLKAKQFFEGAVSHQNENVSNDFTNLQALAEFYAQQGSVDWQAYLAKKSTPYAKADLPHYPFQRQNYWIKETTQLSNAHYFQEHCVHPLLGQQIVHPDGSYLYQRKTDDPSLSYLWDHVVMETAIMPGAAYMEMLLSAGDHVLSTISQDDTYKTVQIDDIHFYAPLILKKNVILQTCITVDKKTYVTSAFIYSRLDDKLAEPTLHAKATISLSMTPATSIYPDEKQMDQQMMGEEFYQHIAQKGYQYQSAFQVIDKILYNASEAVVFFTKKDTRNKTDYYLPPTLLDGALQALILPLLQNPAAENLVFLPTGAEKLLCLRESDHLTSNSRAHIRWQDANISITIYNQHDCCAWIENIKTQSMERTRLQAYLAQLTGNNKQEKTLKDYYELTWKEKESESKNSQNNVEQLPSTLWLVSDTKQAKEIKKNHSTGIIVLADGRHHFLKASTKVMTWEKSKNTEEALIKILTLPQPPHCVVMHASHLVEKNQENTLVQTTQLVLKKLLLVTQQLFTQTSPFKAFLFCSEGAHAQHLEQAGFSGFMRSLWFDLGAQGVTVSYVDIDPQETASPWSFITAELHHYPKFDREVYYHAGKRYLSQLDSLGHKIVPQKPGPYTLVKGKNGLFEELHLEKNSGAQRAVMPHELRVRVRAAGLNFRDLLNVMNLYPGDPGPLGGEFSGVITEVGAALQSQHTPGDCVFGVGSQLTEEVSQRAGSLSSEMIIDGRFALTPPSQLNHQECAGLPIVFLTAYEALVKRARLKKGEKVLIHTATGGVGSAAIQIAQAIGAEIYATAGSERKRNYLKNLGITHIYDSRSLDYGAAILCDTENTGVNVVLNTLTGTRYVETTLKACAKKARFVEISKRNVWTIEEVKNHRHDIQYSILALDDMLIHDIDYVRQLWSDILPKFEKKIYHALPFKNYSLPEVKDAFQAMQRAEHIGKIVVTLAPEFQTKLEKKPGAFLITGGMRGIGFEIAKFFVEQEVESLVLVGRQAPSPEVERSLHAWQERGVKVHLMLYDISDQASVAAIFNQIKEKNIVLRGIIHSAGVIQDTLIAHQTASSFEKVLKPKLAAWYFHHYSQQFSPELEYFVVFSSIAATLGNLGQTNYSAANTFMDALIQQRYQQGLPAQSIQWGPWADIGMAKDNELQHLHESLGFTPFNTEHAIALFSQALRYPVSSLFLADVQWSRIVQIYPGLAQFIKPFLTAPSAVSEDVKQWLSELSQSSLEERQAKIEHRLLALISDVSDISVETIDPDTVFADMGFDSLMMIELHNNLQSAFGDAVNLSPNLIFNYPNPKKLSHYLAESLGSLILQEV